LKSFKHKENYSPYDKSGVGKMKKKKDKWGGYNGCTLRGGVNHQRSRRSGIQHSLFEEIPLGGGKHKLGQTKAGREVNRWVLGSL